MRPRNTLVWAQWASILLFAVGSSARAQGVGVEPPLTAVDPSPGGRAAGPSTSGGEAQDVSAPVEVLTPPPSTPPAPATAVPAEPHPTVGTEGAASPSLARALADGSADDPGATPAGPQLGTSARLETTPSAVELHIRGPPGDLVLVALVAAPEGHVELLDLVVLDARGRATLTVVIDSPRVSRPHHLAFVVVSSGRVAPQRPTSAAVTRP